MAKLSEWAEFMEIDPQGYEIDETRFRMIGALIAAGHGVTFGPNDFTTRPSPEVIAAAADAKKRDDVLSEMERLLNLSPPPASTPAAKL